MHTELYNLGQYSWDTNSIAAKMKHLSLFLPPPLISGPEVVQSIINLKLIQDWYQFLFQFFNISDVNEVLSLYFKCVLEND